MRVPRPNLLELIAALLVVAILGSYGFPRRFAPRHDPQIVAAADLAALQAALATYRVDTDEYPSTVQGLDALVRVPSLPAGSRRWRGPYVLGPIPFDPWGAPYIYRSDEAEGRDGYTLVSYGADSRPGGRGEDADLVVRK